MAQINTPTSCSASEMSKKSPSFSDPYADVILLSSDGVEFQVMKGILVMTSLFFREMFALPQPVVEDQKNLVEGTELQQTSIVPATKPRSQSLPRIQVGEDSHTLDFLLCTIYPVPSPTLDMKADEGAELANKVLEAALKYDMELVKSQICNALISSALATSKASEPSSAVRIYAIACRHGMKGVARDAARACLHGSVIDEYFPELETITAGAYFRLQQYHKSVVRAVSNLIETLSGPGVPNDLAATVACADCGSGPNSQWWNDWKSRATGVLVKAPLSEEIFAVSFTLPALSVDGQCSWCYSTSHGKWHTVEKALKEGIEVAAKSIEIDLTGV